MAVKLSVIVPTHNRAQLVTRAINSLTAQTYKDIEIIVVSDGSTDNTSETVLALAKEDERINYFEHFPAKGANYARNFGVSKAKGDFIAFLDDDDEWEPEKAQKQMQVIESNDSIRLVTSGIRFIYVTNNTHSDYVPHPPVDSSKAILINNVIGGTPAVILKKDLFFQVGGFDENLGARQDYDMWIRCAQKTKIGNVPEPLIISYDYFDPQKISNNTSKHIKSCEIMEEKYKDLYKKLSDKENRLRKYNFSISISKKALRNNEKSLVRKYSFNALKNRFSITPLILIFLSAFKYSFVLKVKNTVFK